MRRLLIVSLLVLSTTAFSQEGSTDQEVPNSKAVRVLQCGGHGMLAVANGIWSLVPFLGNPRFLYNDLKGSGNQLLSRQAESVGVNEHDIILHAGFTAPIFDLLSAGVAAVAVGFREASGNPMDDSEVSRLQQHAGTFRNTRAVASQTVLMASEFLETCRNINRESEISTSNLTRSFSKENTTNNQAAVNISRGSIGMNN